MPQVPGLDVISIYIVQTLNDVQRTYRAEDEEEQWGASVTVSDIRFDNPVLQVVHEHPFWMGMGILIGGGIMVGLATVGIRIAKCGGVS